MSAEESAWTYAESLALVHGIPVFPCRASDEGRHQAKSPYTRRGHLDASADLEQIARWRKAYSDALIAMPTGARSGVWVLDIDPDGHGWFEANRHWLACNRIVHTRRGLHLYYRFTEAEHGMTTSRGNLPQGVDVRAEGGYVILWEAHGHAVEGDAWTL